MTTWVARSRRVVWLLRTLPFAGAVWVVRRLLESRASRQRRLEVALRESHRLVFVCHGNIMRSAFAMQVARAASTGCKLCIVSAGTHARDGSEAEATARVVAERLGVDLSAHQSSAIDSVLLTTNDLVVCMDRMNEANVLMHLRTGARVFLVGDIAADETGWASDLARLSREVADPYDKGESVTQAAFEAIRVLGEMWGRRYSAARAQIR